MSNFVKKTVRIPSLNIDATVLAGVGTLVDKPGKPLEKYDSRYALGIVRYTTPSGQVTEKTAMFWSKTLDNMKQSGREWEVGKNYLMQLSVAENEEGRRLFATCSHLIGAEENLEADNELFDMFASEVAEQATASAELPAI